MEQAMNYPKVRWFVMFTAFICYIAVGAYIIMMAPMVGLMAEDFGVSVGQVSFYSMALYSIVNALAVIASGFLFNRFGVKPVLATGVFVVLAFALALPILTQSIEGVVAFRVALAIGAGPVAGCLAPLGAAWFPPNERGLFSGVVSAGMTVGITASLMILGIQLGATHGDWRASVETLIAIPVVVAVVVVIMLIVTRKTALPASEDNTAEVVAAHNKLFRSILKAPAFYLTIIAYCCFMMIQNSFTDLIPGYIAVPAPMGLGQGAEAASFMSMLQSIGSIVGAVCAGILLDKLFKGKARPLLLAAFAILAVCVFLITVPAVTANGTLLVVVLFLVGFMLMAISTSLTAFIMIRFPLAVSGRVFTWAMGAGLLIGSVGVAVCTGMLHATEGYIAPLMLVLVIAVVGLIPSAVLEKVKLTTGRDESKKLDAEPASEPQ